MLSLVNNIRRKSENHARKNGDVHLLSKTAVLVVSYFFSPLRTVRLISYKSRMLWKEGDVGGGRGCWWREWDVGDRSGIFYKLF